MADTSIRTDAPQRQDKLDEGTWFHTWEVGKLKLELWVYGDAGCILANPTGKFEEIAVVTICGDRMSIVWHGSITDRPQTWLNAQRSVAERAYFGGPDE